MFNRLGIYSLLAGLFVGIFSGISQFMGSTNIWVNLTISKIIGKDTSEAIMEFISISAMENPLNYLIYSVPFFIFLLGIGIILLTIGLFVKNH
ncbi:MAG: hypothetical protein HOG03_01700 [Desulfobacula sp.]|jgi:hypothetical protein|uniref:hypothetical protein n=1 Tax=Desulfobacula sp. TaxID=2593537 RepID=UPI001DDF331B|nr:hypothetical protein [Desulfobacula sp.]MBT3484377.1 hypothetical protein [Desulfobacula sp.]MBT3803292.1 hypothetical protein [Desulfobacula sp.]MBT4023742.1 hypothetical protein [Desulfobacula sp.]MBT4197984.1 hypothetical protein [Desulfobacula sp.]